MNNVQNLTQALDQLKREIQKENSDLSIKETAMKSAITEKQNLENSVKTKEVELKQKEVEIQKLKVEIQQAKNKLPETDRNIKKYTEEVRKIRLEQTQKNQELSNIQREYQDAVKNNSGKK